MTGKVQLCFLLLCHKKPDDVVEQINYLRASDSFVVVHVDKGAPREVHTQIREACKDLPDVEVVMNPTKAGWGDWSLVDATIKMLKLALDKFQGITHFYYLSGDCVPIRPAEELKRDLSAQKVDYIEAFDFFTGNWIKTGPHLERIQYYHFVNERKRKWLFYLSYDLQRLLGIQRKVPEGVTMAIGSQWWCLRRKTIELILVYITTRRSLISFFKRCWIPDEIFFQSMVATLVPRDQIVSRPPTFLRFSDYGLPTTFYDDHYHFLSAQREYFARKISPHARKLKSRLIELFNAPASDETRESTGRATIDFFVYSGRKGIRYNTRIWETGLKLDRDNRLYVVISKKWHVGKRYGEQLSLITGIPFLGYIFDEENIEIGDLGGFETGRNKRLTEPSAFMKIAFNTNRWNQAIIGIDPTRFEELKKLTENNVHVIGIELENQFSREYLIGHAERAGLMTAKGKSVQADSLHRTILETFKYDSHRLRALPFSRFEHIRYWHSAKMHAEIVSNLFEQDSADFLEMTRNMDIKD